MTAQRGARSLFVPKARQGGAAFASRQFPVIIIEHHDVLLRSLSGRDSETYFRRRSVPPHEPHDSEAWGESVAGMNTPLARQHCFVLLNGKRHGPFTFAHLTTAPTHGTLPAHTPTR